MKFSSSVTTSAIAVLSLIASASANTKRCLNTVEENVDYFPDKIVPRYSKQWDISYHNTYKILTNKAEGTSYLMYQCGTQPPVEEEGKHTLTFSVPLQDGVVLSSTTQIPQFEQLGLRRQIRAYIGSTFYISSPCLKTMINEKAIDVLAWNNATEVVAFQADHPETLIIRDSVVPGEANSFVISENDEDLNLEIYEWHKVVGALFNLEATATEQFDEAEARYLCNSDNAAIIAEQRRLEEKSDDGKPKVVWAYHSSWDPTNMYWDVARCEKPTEEDPEGNYNYYCQFAEQCSAELLHSNEGSIPNAWTDGDFHMTDEEFFEFAKDADYFIYTDNNWDTVYEMFKDDLDTFKSVQNQEVYDTAGSGANAWFEGRIAEFDIVLQDFCDVVGHYDDKMSPPHSRHYFRKVIPSGEEPIPDLGTCEVGMVDLPWESRATDCVGLPNAAVGLSSKSKFAFLVPLGVVLSMSLFGF
mmetsp:Transcript_2237/g.2703  ORF Transcript_2237/g.2703 Transcript_2237/m.2703 type:complete len:470 (+) Transcript_2237:359-1768(+)|eukprot:CAMPEP_0203637560 /NCGR_PEP_ID=MMETSP0088-20131115/3849_1 /ASSEMBLY_ACC=CAM_ASM_001087 /TAXON_ID=426623 /ORGANISM="Chaetoceros affinis, Strain CCMP159" /LENGTH=469 /DNA_ID=CAMNT_0050492023 /DNA_START=276 /DNA_END=1685 /DNA_ORIENTATION=+